MTSVRLLLGRMLRPFGFGHSVYHVDAGRRLRVAGSVVDASNGTGIASVAISVERPREGNEKTPQRRPVGETDANGRIDSTIFIRWSYNVANVALPPPVPSLAAILWHAGYKEKRIAFDLNELPRDYDVAQLDLRTVALTKT